MDSEPQQPQQAYHILILELGRKVIGRVFPDIIQENTSTTLSKKNPIIVITLISLVVLDYFTKMTENLMIETKIEKIQKIESALKIQILNVISRKHLILDEQMVTNRHSWQSHFDSFISFIQITINSPIEINRIPKNNASIYYSNFAHIICSGLPQFVFFFIFNYYNIYN